jgi:hypothetical protein
MALRLSNEKLLLVLFLAACLAELTLIVYVSDLQVWLGNWESKSRQLLNFDTPTSNFYGPGSAILLIPFLWNAPNFLVPVYFYFILGCLGYFQLTRVISDKRFMVAALLVVPANPYLIWLCHSSQDTVFEFALLTWSIYFLTKKKWISYSAITFLLAETRAGYWTMFLGLGLILLTLDLYKRRRLMLRRYLAVPLLFVTALLNLNLYGSPSPALEGGITAYFSHSKYLYLSLPKMDMDVFLAGENGIFSKEYGPNIPTNADEVELNSIYQKAALESIRANPKQVILATMQKFESYIFGVQKVPNLPGEYVLDIKNKRIDIGDERLAWSLVAGNFVYEVYRSALVLLGLIGVGMLLALRRFNREIYTKIKLPMELVIPWTFGLIPALLLYTETRFKVVSETLLFLFVLWIWSTISSLRPKTKS